MKLCKLSAIMMGVSAMFALASCNNDSDDPINITRHWAPLNEFRYNTAGIWVDYLNPASTSVSTGSVNFSHSVKEGQWYGFTPVDLDVAAHSGEKAPAEWVCATYEYYLGRTARYLVTHWDSSEEYTFPTDCKSCVITRNDGDAFVPFTLTVNNTLAAYEAMKKGAKDGENEIPAYGDNDECKLMFYGIRNGMKTEETFVYLATKSKVLDGFIEVPLYVLGVVDKVVMTVKVTRDNPDKNLFVPTSFCIADYNWISEEDYNKLNAGAKLN